MRKTQGLRGREGRGPENLPGALSQRRNETSVSVTLRSAIILSSFPRSAVLFWVLLFFSPSHLCMPKMSDKCLIFPSTGGESIMGISSPSMPPPPCHRALPCSRSHLRAEAQLTCPRGACAQTLQPCCSSPVRSLSLATVRAERRRPACFPASYTPRAKESVFCFV